MDKTTPRDTAPETAGKTIRWARWYDLASWLMSFGRAPKLRRDIIEMASLSIGERVLDVGCGTGTLAISAKEKVGASGTVCGIDAAPEMIQVARDKASRKGADVDFRVGLIEALPFAEGEFDVAFSTLMLHHLPEDLKRKGMAEVRRVLKPGGRLIVADLASQSESLVGHAISLFHRHEHFERQTEDLKAILGEAGFTAVEQIEAKPAQLVFLRALA